MAGNHISNCC